MLEQKEAKEDLQALKNVLTQQFRDTKNIQTKSNKN